MSDGEDAVRRRNAIAEYRKKLLQHKEYESRVRAGRENLRAAKKEFNKTEDDLKSLQSVGQIIGEVLRPLDNERLIVKASSGPRYVVGCRSKVDKEKLTSGTRVVLDMTTLTIMRALPREVDPVVYNMLHEDPGNVSYSAVGGLSDQIRELRESIELPLMNPELFLRVGIKPPKGVLLYGPPGTGKTLLARAIASNIDANFLKVVSSAIIDKYIGESARLIREMFGYARDHQPCIIFMDEIDAIGGRRFSEGTSAELKSNREQMGKTEQILLLLISILLLSSSLPVTLCAKKPAAAAPRKEDIPYIKCQVCEKLASQLYQQVQSKQAQISPKKISEYQIIEIAENICNLKKEEADWILKIDLVEQGDKLELVEQDAEGICNTECKTIEKTCQEVMGYSDTDVAEYMYTSKPDIESLANYLCKDLTKACKTKPPPLPKDRTPGEPFVPKPAKEAEMEKMLRSMEGIPGAPSMKMYSREELMNKNFGQDADDADDDDDDEYPFPSNLGKALRNKDNKKGDWKQTIIKGIKDAGETLKRHATKVSFRAQKWWKGFKAARSKASGKTEL